jgi:hypothetical protein
MSYSFNEIEDSLRKKDVKDISTEKLIYYLHSTSKNDQLKIYDKKKIEDLFYKINYSYFFENIFTNKGNYTTISIYIIGLLIPFYINYPKFYNLNGIGFFIGLISFMLLYKQIDSLYGGFFPIASKLFIIISILFYLLFFILFNKLNHISLFFISAVVSFCLINYIYKLVLTIPTKTNKYNKLNVKYIDSQKHTEYNDLIEITCNEIIKRFGLKLPSGKMMYSYLTIFEIGENNEKIPDFLTNLFAPIITLFYNYFLGSFLESITNNTYHGKKSNVISIIGGSEQSKKYISCQANYVLPIEFNFNSFLHEFYIEERFDDDTYRLFIKAIKRINHELLSKYEPKFVKLEDLTDEQLVEHMKNSSKDKNHILVQIQNFFKDKGITNFNNKIDITNYTSSIKTFIEDSSTSDKDKNNAIELLNKMNQTLEIKTNITGKENSFTNNNFTNDFADNSKLAIESLLNNESIDKKNHKLLKELCENYVGYFRKNIKEDKLEGYNYNLWTYSMFSKETRDSANNWFYIIIKIISVYILFGRPLTSPWMLSIFVLIPYIQYEQYFKYFTEGSSIMKYLSLGMDTECFTDEYDNNINNNTIYNKGTKMISKILIYLIICLPFLQFFNNTFYGLTFYPLYTNVIYQGVFILNLIGNVYCETLEWEPMTFNIIYWAVFFIIKIILYFVFNKKKS